MLLKLNNKYRQRGIGLLELMLSLAIISLLLIMATRYYASASRSQQVTSALSSMHALGAAIHSYQAQTGGTPPVTLDLLYDRRLIPVEFKNPTGGANPWGGAVSITATTVKFDGIQADACIQLSMALGSVKGGTCTGGSVTYNFGAAGQ
jgi:type II secretory pathway pseudopilin PulG